MSSKCWFVCLVSLPITVLATQFGDIPVSQVIGTPTITNDANVTLTLGGTPTDALLKPFSLTLGWTGTLSIARGGTGGAAFESPLTFSTGLSRTVNAVTAPNSPNWDTAYTDRLKWDGGATGLVAATGRTSLGLVIGTNVEAWDADLDTWATLTPSANFQTMVPHTFAQIRIDLGLVIGTNVQAWNTNLDALAALAGNSKFAFRDSTGVWATRGLGTNLSEDGTNINAAGGGGGGTVTSFSAGNLSPLFTTSVATATTTPALTFSLTNAGVNTWFGNSTASPAAPAFNVNGALTETDDTNVTMTLGGTPATALLKATSITLGWTGTLAVARGGTGVATAAANTVFGNNTAGVAAPVFSSAPRFTSIGNLTSNGFVKTSGGVGTLSVDTSTYLTSVTSDTSLSGSGTGVSPLALNIQSNSTLTGAGTAGSPLGVAVGTDLAWTAPQTHTLTDAGTTNAINTLSLRHDTSGTPAANFGVAIQTYAETTTTLDQNMGNFRWYWSNATHASRTGQVDISLMRSGAGPNVVLTVFGSGGMGLNRTVDPGLGTMDISGVYETNGSQISTNDLLATATNDTPAAGKIGQVVAANSTSSTGLSYTTGQQKNLLSVSLTAGDWDVHGVASYFLTSVPASTSYNGTVNIGTTTGALADDGEQSYANCTSVAAALTVLMSAQCPSRRISLASTTTVYMVAKAPGFTSGTCSIFGFLEAKRIR